MWRERSASAFALVCCGCGRLGFEPRVDGKTAKVSSDGPAVAVARITRQHGELDDSPKLHVGLGSAFQEDLLDTVSGAGDFLPDGSPDAPL